MSSILNRAHCQVFLPTTTFLLCTQIMYTCTVVHVSTSREYREPGVAFIFHLSRVRSGNVGIHLSQGRSLNVTKHVSVHTRSARHGECVTRHKDILLIMSYI